MIIEHGRPIPDARSVLVKYPFRSLAVGDSFFVANPTGSQAVVLRVRGAANMFARRNGVKFAIRKIDGGIRVWRVQ